MEFDNITHCNGYRNIIILSEICVSSFNSTLYECIRSSDNIKSILRTLMGIWSLLILVCGTFGNLLTLVAIPYAAKHKRYELNRNFQTTTIFVLHLAFVDLSCSLVLGPIYLSTYFPEIWPWGLTACKLVFPITIAFMFIDWLSLSFVALSRCINLTKPIFWSNLCERKVNLALILVIIWILGIFLSISYIIEPGVKFGWNCESGLCGIVPASSKPILKWRTLILFFLPIIIVTISYALIFFHVKKTSRYLSRDEDSRSNRLDERELKMTWSILMIFFCYLFCAAPIIVLTILYQKASYYWIFANGLYLTLFMLNFIVYSYQNEQYQKAFIDYLKMLKYLMSNGSLRGYKSRHQEETMKKISSTCYIPGDVIH